MVALAGQHGKPSTRWFRSRRPVEPNVFIAIGTTVNSTIQAGALIDRRATRASVDGRYQRPRRRARDVRRAHAGRSDGQRSVARRPLPRAHVLPDGRLLVSWADGPVNDIERARRETPPDFGIYIYDPGRRGRTSSSTTTRRHVGALRAAVVAPHRAAASQPVQNTQDSTIPLRHRLHRRSPDVALQRSTRTPSTGASSTTARRSTTRSSDGRQGPHHRGLLERSGAERHDVRSDDGRGRGDPRRGAGLRGRSWLANVPPFIPMHLQPSTSSSSRFAARRLWIQGHAGREPRLRRLPRGAHRPTRPSARQQPIAASSTGHRIFIEPIAERTEYPVADSNVTGSRAKSQPRSSTPSASPATTAPRTAAARRSTTASR